MRSHGTSGAAPASLSSLFQFLSLTSHCSGAEQKRRLHHGSSGPAPASLSSLGLLLGLFLGLLSLCSGAELPPRLLQDSSGDPIFFEKWVIEEHILNPDCQFDRPTVLEGGLKVLGQWISQYPVSSSHRVLFLNPDCQFDRPTVLVGTIMPGPEITVVEGTRVVVEVHNKQKYPVTIHWHGITQNNSQWYDGVHRVTQCDIAGNTTFTYDFSTWGNSGTLWWHAHVSFLRHTLHGGLFVEPRPETRAINGRKPLPVSLAGDATLILSDWYHESPEELETYVPFWTDVQTSLINGATFVPDAPASCQRQAMFELSVKPRRWYRLRVINAGLLAALNFAIQGHQFFLYEGEGGYLAHTPFRSYTILSGQSYAFLLYTGQKPRNYWIAARPTFDNAGTPPGLALLRYQGASPRLPPFRSFLEGPSPDLVADMKRRTVGAKAPAPWVSRVDKLVVLELGYDTVVSNDSITQTHWSLNNATLALPPIPPLYTAYKGRTPTLSPGFTPDLPPPGLHNYTGRSKNGFGTIEVPLGSVVQLVIQNARKITMNPHPFHLHGHNFYVVAQGKGTFNVTDWQNVSYNLKNPYFRNTMWVEENGWTAVRFLADNPGTWLLHCHLEPHADGGMMAVFYVPGGIGGIPSDYPKCHGQTLT